MNETDLERKLKRENQKFWPLSIRRLIAPLILSLFTFASAAQAQTASIDVLVVYTPAVKVDQGDHDGVVAAAQVIIDKANLGFENSSIDAEFNLVHVEEIPYTESATSYEDDLNAITNEDGVVDNVLTLREDWGADLIYLFRDGNIGGTAGLGWILKDETGRDVTGFSVGSVQSSVSANTFTHEAGHNFGAAHDADNSQPDDGLFLYSHGHHFAAGISGNFRTIMAYQKNGNIQVNFFSNPNVTHLGVATGVAEGNPDPADNARTLNTSTPVVAAYRVNQTEIPSFPTPFPNLAFVEGQSKTILAQAVGHPPLSYQWYEGVSGDTSTPVSGATSESFTTPPLNDTTVYWVRVTNPNGSGDSPSITLTTTAAPTEPNVSNPDQNHDPDDFTDFFLQFSVANGETWQEFVPAQSYLHDIEVKIWKNGNPGRMSLKFTDENSVVLFSKIYEEGDIPSGSQWLNIPLQMYVNVGTTYRITLQRLDTKEIDSIKVNDVDELENLSSNIVGTQVSVFIADNDTITIGDDEKFEEIQISAITGATAPGVAPTFEYSTGVDTWAAFTPTDGTNGFQSSGLISWNNASIPNWAAGTGSEFLIRITRTEDTVTTVPELFLIQDRRFFAWQSTDWAADGDSYTAGGSSRDKDGEFYDYYFHTTGSSASPPTATIDLAEKTVAGGPSSYDITVTSTGDWTANEALDWLSLSPSSGTGNGTVTVTVEANDTGLQRSGSILVGGNNHTITQSAPVTTIDPIERTLAGGPTSYEVIITSNGGWTASEALDWVTLSAAIGTGNGTVTVNVAGNNTGSERMGSILIGGNNHTITQSASAFVGSVDPTQANFGISGGNGSFDLTTSHVWNASSDSWITITSATSGTGDATVNYAVSQNATASLRIGAVTIESIQHIVRQKGDVNGQGLNFDDWLLGYYTSDEIAALSPSAGEADLDDDGLNNDGEFLLQLDPTSDQSRPQIIVSNSQDGIIICITPQVDGVDYRLNSSQDLETWTPEPSLAPAFTEGKVTFTIPPGSEAFFQLEIEASP